MDENCPGKAKKLFKKERLSGGAIFSLVVRNSGRFTRPVRAISLPLQT
jgi:hypothetical protein